jgi:hypothetical protein
MYKIRKVEKFTILQHTETANLDPEKFRQFGYEGNSEEEFLTFIEDLDIDDVYDDLDEETRSELSGIKMDYSWFEYYNTAWDGENSWFEIGEENPNWTKTGGFEIRHSTSGDYN